MRDGKPSRTARSVALFRAIASDPKSPYSGVDDPLATRMLGVRKALAYLGRRAPGIARNATFGLLTHVALRTALIDAAIRQHVRAVDQLVILGAGLDTRGFRLDELGQIDAFEVDHPASQAEKRARLGSTSHRCRSLRFVPIDFERESLETKLAKADHVPSRATIWIWEGVTPYLHRSAIEQTLAAVSTMSAPGSVLIMSYATPEMARAVGLPDGGPLMRRIIQTAFYVLGEPLHTRLRAAEAAELVTRFGFRCVEDGGDLEWGARFLKSGSPRLVIGERVLVAIKQR